MVVKFGGGSGRFNPGLYETEQVRLLAVNPVTECDRAKRMKNAADVESTDSEDCRTRVCHSVSPDRTRMREEAIVLAMQRTAGDSRLGTDAVGVLLTSRELQGRMI